MSQLNRPRIRPSLVTGERVTLGLHGPMISSPSHEAWGGQNPEASDAQHWTPHGTLRAVTLPWQHRMFTLRGLPAQSVVTVSPGAYFNTPALFQIIGIPDRNLVLTNKPASGRTGTPPVRHAAINPFPAFKPPLPSYPLPASWPGSF